MLKYISLLRSRHWIKNLFIFAPPFFGGRLFDAQTLTLAVPAFMALSLCASASYIINDIKDIKNDSLHHKKKNRPLTSGIISKRNAATLAIFMAAISFVLSYIISLIFFYFVLSYFLIQLAYSAYLKNIALADIFCIASGFVIRVLAGGAAFNIAVSNWLLLTMFMISIVLASGKRLAEFGLLNHNAAEHRKSLIHYSPSILNEILLISSSASLISYALYTIEQFHALIYTIPIATFGLFRYVMLSKNGMGDPTDALTGDKWLALIVAFWLLVVGFIRYM